MLPFDFKIETAAHVATVFTFIVGFSALWFEARRFRRLQAAEHRRKLGDRALQLLQDHDASFDRDSFRFRALAANLDPRAVQAIKAGDEFELDLADATRWLDGSEFTASGTAVVLVSRDTARRIRHDRVRELNFYDTVAQMVLGNQADAEQLEAGFKFHLLDPAGFVVKSRGFREAWGVGVWESLNELDRRKHCWRRIVDR